MKNFLVIEQDDASFTINDASTDAEKSAERIIESFNNQKEAVIKAARAAHPVRFSPSARALVGEVENYKSAIENGMRGYSYTREGSTETWATPNATLVATFLGCVGEYKNKFSFDIF